MSALNECKGVVLLVYVSYVIHIDFCNMDMFQFYDDNKQCGHKMKHSILGNYLISTFDSIFILGYPLQCNSREILFYSSIKSYARITEFLTLDTFMNFSYVLENWRYGLCPPPLYFLFYFVINKI